ncbi:DUF6313 family protein [Streptomyces acidiscabies]|uniref:DUF6313 family protein n=1 Tax=Streptomyces acidiscabies TaxID=42234 RepID=UPI0038F613EC
MTSLKELYDRGGEEKHFAEEYVQLAHAGKWDVAKDHWTFTVQHFADNALELEELPPKRAWQRAEELALALCKTAAQDGKCWACAVG